MAPIYIKSDPQITVTPPIDKKSDPQITVTP